MLIADKCIWEFASDAPTRTAPDHPFIQLIVAAVAVYEKPIRLIPLAGGSGPNHPYVHALGLPVATAEMGDPDTKTYAPNENVQLGMYLKHARHMARVVRKSGEEKVGGRQRSEGRSLASWDARLFMSPENFGKLPIAIAPIFCYDVCEGALLVLRESSENPSRCSRHLQAALI